MCSSAPSYQFACHHRNAIIQIRGHLQILEKDTAALGPKAFSKSLSSTVEAYNYHAETHATITSHTIQCVHKLPVEKNIYLSLIVVIKSMTCKIFKVQYFPPGVPYCNKSMSTHPLNAAINLREAAHLW